jgi:putative ABC transport system ATP-binding protein
VTGAAVELQDLRYAWPGQASPCLDIAAFRVERGESIFVHGDSGSGKSTLLALLGGVLAPQAGSIRVLDTELTALSSAQRDRFRVDHTGFIFQQFNLIPLPVDAGQRAAALPFLRPAPQPRARTLRHAGRGGDTAAA